MAKKYSLGYGFMGNGTTVWNRAEEVNGDYKTIAHIGVDGTLHIYESNLPSDVMATLETAARQDAIQYQSHLFPIRE